MRNSLSKNELEQVDRLVDLFYETTNDAYLDVRESIDGLRISPAETGLIDWFTQVSNDFRETSGINVETLDVRVYTSLVQETQAQLIRIVQEAMSNIRKHSQAERVWIECYEEDDFLVLEIRDDGIGFIPEDVSLASRHGLRGMQERATLMGAEFQVISHHHEGTIVRLRLPLANPRVELAQ
jgi:signal transduction histidine kinase